MILGQGVDIVEISRIAKAFNKFGERFVNKFLSQEEILMMPKERNKIVSFLVKHWAVKEAASKAVGCGLINGSLLHFNDITLSKEEKQPFTGRPIIKLNNHIIDVVAKMYNLSKDEMEKIVFHISISGDGAYVVASVILELQN